LTSLSGRESSFDLPGYLFSDTHLAVFVPRVVLFLRREVLPSWGTQSSLVRRGFRSVLVGFIDNPGLNYLIRVEVARLRWRSSPAISSAANATSSDAPSESSREPRGASDAVNVADSMFASLYLASAAPAPVPPAAFDNGGGKADRCYVDDVISAPADSNPPVEAPEF